MAEEAEVALQTVNADVCPGTRGRTDGLQSPQDRARTRSRTANQRQRELGRDKAKAQKLVAIWNSRAARKARQSFYPTIETALLAGTPWLAYQCPACQLIGDVDLSTLDRHPTMSISGLIPSLSCRLCCANPPFAKLIALTADSTVAAAVRRRRRRIGG